MTSKPILSCVAVKARFRPLGRLNRRNYEYVVSYVLPGPRRGRGLFWRHKLDCPVTGGNIAAAKGTLGLLVGGDNAALNRCRDAFAPPGKVYHCGSIGMGQIAKLANNAVAYTTAAAVDEARVMANAYGMDLGTLMQVIGHGTGQCFVADKWDYVGREWSHLRALGKKDVGLWRWES